jgi:hypothetical protein
MEYQINASSLFAGLARSAKTRYIVHRDWVLNKWNVFKLENGIEDFVQAFDRLVEAEDFCSINNRALGGE